MFFRRFNYYYSARGLDHVMIILTTGRTRNNLRGLHGFNDLHGFKWQLLEHPKSPMEKLLLVSEIECVNSMDSCIPHPKHVSVAQELICILFS